MSSLTLLAPPPPTLADLLGQALDDALASGAARCLWCGAQAPAVVADRWTGRVLLRCRRCGSELEGESRHRPAGEAA